MGHAQLSYHGLANQSSRVHSQRGQAKFSLVDILREDYQYSCIIFKPLFLGGNLFVQYWFLNSARGGLELGYLLTVCYSQCVAGSIPTAVKHFFSSPSVSILRVTSAKKY